VKPIAGYEDLLETNETLIKDNANLRSVILLNCGGGIDLGKVCERSFTRFVSIARVSHQPCSLADVEFG
jgi:cell division control protein 45